MLVFNVSRYANAGFSTQRSKSNLTKYTIGCELGLGLSDPNDLPAWPNGSAVEWRPKAMNRGISQDT